MTQSCAWLYGGAKRLIQMRKALVFFVLCGFAWFIVPKHTQQPVASFRHALQSTTSIPHTSEPSHNDALLDPVGSDQLLHVLLTGDPAESNLKNPQDHGICRTLLSASLLGYPPPTLISHITQQLPPAGLGEEQDPLTGTGPQSRIANILKWLESVTPEREDDIVMIVDGSETWMQLPKDLLVERYHRINRKADRWNRQRLGRAAAIENVKQTVVFGSRRQCTPYDVHSVACWPLPAVPLDWDDSATDNRFMDSGFAMGPIKEIRRVFKRATELVEELGGTLLADSSATNVSSQMSKVVDQAVLSLILGEQEYFREKMRLRHLSWLSTPGLKLQQLLGKDLSDTDSLIEGEPVRNILNPPWPHAPIEAPKSQPREFGIGLDYGRLLSLQSSDPVTAGQDTSPSIDWFRHGQLATDIEQSSPPLLAATAAAHSQPTTDEHTNTTSHSPWQVVPLLTLTLTKTIPVSIHAGERTRWSHMWFAPDAARLYKSLRPVQGISFANAHTTQTEYTDQSGSASSDSTPNRNENRNETLPTETTEELVDADIRSSLRDAAILTPHRKRTLGSTLGSAKSRFKARLSSLASSSVAEAQSAPSQPDQAQSVPAQPLPPQEAKPVNNMGRRAHAHTVAPGSAFRASDGKVLQFRRDICRGWDFT